MSTVDGTDGSDIPSVNFPDMQGDRIDGADGLDDTISGRRRRVQLGGTVRLLLRNGAVVDTRSVTAAVAGQELLQGGAGGAASRHRARTRPILPDFAVQALRKAAACALRVRPVSSVPLLAHSPAEVI